MIDQRLSPVLELKFAPDATAAGRVKGYASTWGGPPDAHGDVIAAGAFTKTLAEHRAQGSKPALLWAHDQSRPIGRLTRLLEDDVGLLVEGQLNLETVAGRDAAAHIKAGDATGLSIGYALAAGGAQRGTGGAMILTEIHLAEVSVVALPANRKARVHLEGKRDLEELLVKSGVAKAAATRLAAGGWPALAGEDPEKRAREINDTAARIRRLAKTMGTAR